MNDGVLKSWEFASYIAVVLGLPWAIVLFMYESYKERQVEGGEIYQKLAEEYAKFGNLLIHNADLQLVTGNIPDNFLSPEQKERKKVIFDMLVALFERAYILVYQKRMSRQTRRLWATWEDYIKFWCRRDDFRAALPDLLIGEDPEFVSYIRSISGMAEQYAHVEKDELI